MELWKKWQESRLRKLLTAIKNHITFSINPKTKENYKVVKDQAKQKDKIKNFQDAYSTDRESFRESFRPSEESIARASTFRDTLTEKESIGYVNHNKKSFEIEQSKASGGPSRP